MKRLRYVIFILASLNLGGAAQQNSVSQWGITWTFDKSYEVGQFANGDWWVKGPVTITGITPEYRVRDFWDFTVSQTKGVVFKRINGWQVNPTYSQKQGFDEALYDFDSTLVPDLPYLAAPGQSIVKAVSDTNPDNMDTRYQPDTRMRGINSLLTAGVLTVVDVVPPDSGRTVFRPPYVGTDKHYYSTNDLRTELLPSLAPVTDAPTLAWVEDQFKRVQLNHKGSTLGALLRPKENMASSYQPYNGVRNDKGALRLMLNDPLQDKMSALIVFVQYGIDIYHFILGGQTWPEGYGVEPGHKLPLAFAAVLLDDQAMKNVTGNSTFLQENGSMTLSQNGIAIWGTVDPFQTDQEYSYWNYIMHPPSYNTSNARDPYGYIDNSITGKILSEGYQLCCLSQPFKGETLAGLLMPEMQPVWNQPDFFQYVDRWVNHGVLTQPDPCAPAEGIWSGGPNNGQRCTSAQDSLVDDAGECIIDSSKYRVAFGPDPNRHGDCLRDTDPSDGIGRFPSRDGINQDGGGVGKFVDYGYRSSFVDYMWEAYRAGVPVASPSISPNGGTFAGAVDVRLAPDIASWRPEIRYTTDGTDPIASSALYTGPVRLTSSADFRARAFFGSYTPSAVVKAAFTVTADNQGPVISSIITKNDSTKVTVVFSELVDSVTARQAANYTIDKGITVTAAALAGNGPTVVLTVSDLQIDTVYTLSVTNVQDLSGNTVAANTQKNFTFINFDPVAGLTGYWPFDTDQGTIAKDQSGYNIGFGYDGTVTGATWVPGRIGQGIQFSSAAENVKLKDSQYSFGMAETQELTIAYWINITGHNSTLDDIVGRPNGCIPCGPIPYTTGITNTGHLQTVINTASTPNTLNSTTVLTDSVWYHVALTYRESSRVLYINGVKDEGGSNNLAVGLGFPNMGVTHFGCGHFVSGFSGILDEVRFYNRALSASQITHLAADTTIYTSIREEVTRPLSLGSVRLGLANPMYNLDFIRAHPGRFRIYTLGGRPVETGALPANGVYLLENKENRRLHKVMLVK